MYRMKDNFNKIRLQVGEILGKYKPAQKDLYYLDIIFKVAASLSQLHAVGIGHYDLKGLNIFMMNYVTPILSGFVFT